MVPTTEIKLNDIETPKSMMMRVKLDSKTVTKYAKDMHGGAVFPPIIVYEVDGQMILVDGYHRHSAYGKCGVETVHADVQIGRTMDDALLAAVRANSHEGLKRTDADKEKSVKALLASEKWCDMSENEIGREAGVSPHTVKKIKKSIVSTMHVHSSIAPSKETRLGKDGKRRPATRLNPTTRPVETAPTPAATPSSPPPLRKFTWQQIGAPAPGTEQEQDPESPPGVTRAMAWSAKHGHVQLVPLDEKMKAERERKVIGFIAALKDLGRTASEVMRHDMEPGDFLATLQGLKGSATATKFDERMSAIEPLLTRLTALNAMRAKKSAAA